MRQKYNPDAVRSLFQSGLSFSECCVRAGWNRRKAENVYKILCRERDGISPNVEPAPDPPPLPEPSITESGDSREMEGFSTTAVSSEEELIAKFHIDTDIWQIDKWKCQHGAWQMGYKDKFTQKPGAKNLYSYKTWALMSRRVLLIAMRAEVAAMVEKAAEWAFPYPAVHGAANAPQSGIMPEISIYDHHLGKLCWARETGTDYDLKIASESYGRAAEYLVAKSRGFDVERFLFVVGNDFLNADNPANTTTKGTPQAMDGRYPKIFRRSRELVVSAIDLMLETAPVEVLMIPGNHDMQSTFVLGDTLLAWYRNCPDVTINNEPSTRKYFQWGKCLLGFAHGDKQKAATLPLQMATDVPGMWGETMFREYHTGHYHTERSYELNGVIVRSLPSLTGTDSWHHENGYNNNMRSAQAFIWSKDDGLTGTLMHTLKPG